MTDPASIQVDVQKLRELTAENRLLLIENLKLRARVMELEQEVKRLNNEWAADPTVKESKPLLPTEDEDES